MEDYEYFNIPLIKEADTEEKIEKLKQLLLFLGVTIELKEPEFSKVEMTVMYNKKRVKEKLTRGAGKKKGKGQNPESLTWSEVLKLKEEKTAEEVANILNMSRDTFYRRLRDRPKKSQDTDIFR